MLEWIIIFASVVIMARAADMEHKSSFLWGVITLGLCLLCIFTIPVPLLRAVMGLILSYSLMFAIKVVRRQ